MKLSLVIPCYNEQDNVELFYNTATEVFKDKGFDYELIFVNDGSRDQTMDKLRHIYEIAGEKWSALSMPICSSALSWYLI